MASRKIKPSLKKKSFFKVLVDDFSQHLCIPPAFVENLNGGLHHKCALGGPSGQLWDVELEETENGLFLHDGWEDFVKDHGLEVGNFLVFTYDGGSKFDVTIYDKSACEKDVELGKSSGNPISSASEGNKAQVKDEDVEIESENYNHHSTKEMNIAERSHDYVISGKRPANHHSVEERSNGSILFKSENSCFTTFNYSQYRVTIPKKLAISKDLITKKAVKVQDPAGRSWLIKLQISKSPKVRFDMTAGWANCCRANEISATDTLIFEFVKRSVMQLHIFRERVRGSRCSVVLSPTIKN